MKDATSGGVSKEDVIIRSSLVHHELNNSAIYH